MFFLSVTCDIYSTSCWFNAINYVLQVCCSVVIANFPGLYLMTEAQSVVAQMNPGQSRLSADRVDVLMRQFFQRVKQTLHVIICLRFSRKSSFFVALCC